jgi:hypothetical protein
MKLDLEEKENMPTNKIPGSGKDWKNFYHHYMSIVAAKANLVVFFIGLKKGHGWDM